MKNNTLIKITAAFALLALCSCLVQQCRINEYKDIINHTDTVTVVDIKYDTTYVTKTIKDTVPVYKTKTIIKTDTIHTNDSTYLLTLQQKEYENTLYEDEDTITYNAFVTGYNINNQPYPTLDSINLSLKRSNVKEIEYVTKYVKVPEKRSKWHLSPSVGIGFGLINKKPDVYLGITLGYDIFK